jgi:RNA polymerase sigma-70 factor, ECF subfamily
MQTGADVTRLLKEWRTGNQSALDELASMVYQELRRLASSHMRRERPDHTLQPTALINETYLRLMGQKNPDFTNRAHFFGVASQLMRQILVEFARKHKAVKRGSGAQKANLDEIAIGAPDRYEEVLQIDELLTRLGSFDERKAKVLELRYFGGLTREEVAEAMGLTLATVKRDLTLAEAWLRREISGESSGPAANAAGAGGGN